MDAHCAGVSGLLGKLDFGLGSTLVVINVLGRHFWVVSPGSPDAGMASECIIFNEAGIPPVPENRINLGHYGRIRTGLQGGPQPHRRRRSTAPAR
jgi:hypothetical protein